LPTIIYFKLLFFNFSALPALLLNINADSRDHSTCTLLYNEQEHWMQAIWNGYVDPSEAQSGAASYLSHAMRHPSPYLLNDNSRLQGPWFESLDWLAEVWVPQAEQLGLRYVAHIMQADRPYDCLSVNHPLDLPFELQIFKDAEEARDWLRQVRDMTLASTTD
jgi:hypothetical protein